MTVKMIVHRETPLRVFEGVHYKIHKRITQFYIGTTHTGILNSVIRS